MQHHLESVSDAADPTYRLSWSGPFDAFAIGPFGICYPGTYTGGSWTVYDSNGFYKTGSISWTTEGSGSTSFTYNGYNDTCVTAQVSWTYGLLF